MYKPQRGKVWRAIRLQVLERDNYTCQKCGIVNPPRISAHHRTPFEITQDNSLENLIALCNSCHRSVEISLQKQKGTFYFKGTTEAWTPERRAKQAERMRKNTISPADLPRNNAGKFVSIL